MGDRFEFDFEFTGQYQAWRDLSLSALYKYGFKLEDRISARKGFPTQVFEKDTDSTEQIYIVPANYSTLALDIALSYRDRFAGSGPDSGASPSQVLKARYITSGCRSSSAVSLRAHRDRSQLVAAPPPL